MNALMATLSGWASVVGVFFLASLITQGITRENLAKLREQDSPEMILVIIMQVMAEPSLILLIGLVGVVIIIGAFLFGESRR